MKRSAIETTMSRLEGGALEGFLERLNAVFFENKLDLGQNPYPTMIRFPETNHVEKKRPYNLVGSSLDIDYLDDKMLLYIKIETEAFDRFHENSRDKLGKDICAIVREFTSDYNSHLHSL